MSLLDLETPALILDKAVLARNAARMTAHITSKGVRLRPHLKTAKSIDVARFAIKDNFGGIIVSTLKEAEYFAEHGITDITYGVGVVPEKMGRVVALLKKGVRLSVILDQVAVAEAISAIAAKAGVIVPTSIELDSGEKRAGLLPDSDELVALGLAIEALPGLMLEGVLTHAGQSYQGRSIEAIAAFAELERLCAVRAAERLRAAGLVVPVVSVGSTPTATHGRNFEGLTEVRCGVYMFGDVFQSEIGSMDLTDCAVSVLATVIGHRPELNTALIDAGALALSKDRSTAAPGLAEDIGFGLILDAKGEQRIDKVIVGHVYQEHGLLTAQGPFPYDKLPVGARVRVLPNHVCMTSAMHPGYTVLTDGDDSALSYWPRVNGW
jgi:D-serine deaminase-like pyridoxal phosphate-dependent protein